MSRVVVLPVGKHASSAWEAVSAHLGKCIQQFAPNAEWKLWFLSGLLWIGRYIAVAALMHVKDNIGDSRDIA
ncbi:MAG: hypothetical protein LUF25_01040 [Phascolarctobacterium sp.]|nr:hypothetical protein [Phascolarctobacterium sp.]